MGNSHSSASTAFVRASYEKVCTSFCVAMNHATSSFYDHDFKLEALQGSNLPLALGALGWPKIDQDKGLELIN